MLTEDERSRYRCSTGQYHQVVAISELMLNAQLETYFNIEEKMRSIKQGDRFLGSFTAQLDPPRISIPRATGVNLSELNYHIRFKSGEMNYYANEQSIEGVEDVLLPVNVANWEIVFKVNLSLESIESAEIEDIKKMLRVAGEYSIQRLVLLFADANTSAWNEPLTKTPMPAGTVVLPNLKKTLSAWIRSWLTAHSQIEKRLQGKVDIVVDANTGRTKEVTGARSSILYHALAPRPEDVNPVRPELPPTVMIHQTYSFADSVGKPNMGSTDLNCLLYLEMCNKEKELPKTKLLENQGNYVTSSNGSKQILGSLCLSSRILFEEYLLKFFRPIVKEAELSIQKVKVNGAKSFEFAYAFGQNPNHSKYEDNYFLMKRQTGSDGIYEDWFGVNKGGDGMQNLNGWRWVNEYSKPKDEQKFGGIQSTFQLTARSICNLKYSAGSNKLNLHGWTTLVMSLTFGKRQQVASTGDWEVDLTFKASDYGRLVIDVDWRPDLVNFVHWTEERDMDLGDKSAKSVMKEMEDRLRESIEKLKPYFENLRDQLKQQSFVLSGGGYFYMNNPCFTEKGDLLVELAYNGVPPNGEPSKKPQLGPVPQAAHPVPDSVNATVAPTSVGMNF